MADLIFKVSPNVVLGSYTLSRLAQYVKPWGSKFMIILDPVLKDVNLTEKITEPLTERKIDYFIFDGLTDGANTKDIEKALVLAIQGHVHGIIAVGGAKAIHAGCAVSALNNENHSINDYMDGAVPTSNSLP